MATPNNPIEIYRRLFVNRNDVWALQNCHGYIKQATPVTPMVIANHLCGIHTAGWYALSKQSTAKWACVDSDDGIDTVYKAQKALARCAIPGAIELSGRGGHLWVFFQQPIAGAIARLVTKTILDQARLNVEVYPKQAYIEPDGYGSLVRGPLGKHRKYDRFFGFLVDGREMQDLDEQLEYLSDFPKVKPEHYQALFWALRPQPKIRQFPAQEINQPDIVELVSQYTQLRPRSGGLMGKCPFHDDTIPSLSVSPEKQLWHCFACDEGGDAISFLMRAEKLTFKQALEKFRGERT